MINKKICEYCGKEHDGSYGSGRFCSEHCTHLYITKNRITKEQILNGDYKYPNVSKVKNWLIKFGIKEAKCEKCGNTMWLGQPICLELHHIDGNQSNNNLENLQILCPNCHSQTDNWKSKKLVWKKKKET